MMLTLDDIRGYIGGLGITADRNVYIGKLNSKKDHSIGVYHRQGSGPPVMALGGHDYSSYNIRPEPSAGFPLPPSSQRNCP